MRRQHRARYRYEIWDEDEHQVAWQTTELGAAIIACRSISWQTGKMHMIYDRYKRLLATDWPSYTEWPLRWDKIGAAMSMGKLATLTMPNGEKILSKG